jgi:hypothetical protein
MSSSRTTYGTGANAILFAGKYPGVLGNSLKVVLVNGSGTTGATLTAVAANQGQTYIEIHQGSGAAQVRYFSKGDDLTFVDGTTVTLSGIQRDGLDVSSSNFDFFGQTGGTSNSLRLVLDGYLPVGQAAGSTLTIKSAYAKQISTTATTTQFAADNSGSGDLVSVIVLDKDGTLTGVQNGLVEKFEALSRASNAKKGDGSSNYYRDVLNDQSQYLWALSADIGSTTSRLAGYTLWTALGVPSSATTTVGAGVNSVSLRAGSDVAPTDSIRWQNGWSKFVDADGVDVSLLPLGNASSTLAPIIVQNVCEKRLDCMAFLSPRQTDVENTQSYQALNNIKTYRDSVLNLNSSYAVMDSGWKYQLDTYNNIIRAVPLNGDIAGLVARTEFTNDAWFSPAGYNRGQIKNVVKILYNPASDAHRDELYTRQVNPVVSFPGDGVILFGDKTMQTRPSAFDRINVRRLFIVLEKAIATASKFFLFEQNDAFTRAQFKNLVVPFLRTVQQRRGITDFKVVCDETNNTGEVIDRNEFVADIFIKPTRSINFIQLNFVATKTGVDFSEVGG